jgi:nitrogen fixation protein FixH
MSNWVKGIVIVYVLFMTGILSIVVIANQHHSELVAEDYYERGQRYQTILDAKKRVSHLKVKPSVMVSDDKVVFKTPVKKGKLVFFCPADSTSDFEKPVNENEIEFPIPMFKKGFFKVQYQWMTNNELYYWEEDLYLK